MLMMVANIKFKVNNVDIFDKLVELLLQNRKYNLLETFISNIFIVCGVYPSEEDDEDEEKHPQRIAVLINEFNNEECDVMERVKTCVIKWARAKYYKIKPLGYNSPTQ